MKQCKNLKYVKSFRTQNKNPFIFENFNIVFKDAKVLTPYYLYNEQNLLNGLLEQTLVCFPCGKCEYCKGVKRLRYSKLLSAELNKPASYGYLLTITFNDECIDKLPFMKVRASGLIANEDVNFIKGQVSNQTQCEHPQSEPRSLNTTHVAASEASIPNEVRGRANGVSAERSSLYSTLNKRVVGNIIRNLKKKVLLFYKGVDVRINYFLCGEYGPSTKRAHYHIVWIMDKPFPKLSKLPVKGEHFTSPLMRSSQYGFYDIQQIKNVSNAVGSYVSKYLMKENQEFDTVNYNLFEQSYIDFLKDRKLLGQDVLIPNSRDDLIHILALNDCNDFDTFLFILNKVVLMKFKPVGYQREFLKRSRNLGLSEDFLYNLKNNLLSRYYISKFKFKFNCTYWKLMKSTTYNKPLVEEYHRLKVIREAYLKLRHDNIIKHFTQSIKRYKNKINDGII